ncbi:MAG: GTP-binding protein [Chloroflexi bacterium]|nr:GTP-binding protein [Chloroflexota bacterium]
MGASSAIKVVVAGDGNVGKTSLVRRYCEGKFEASRVMTIGVDFQTKVVELPGGAVKLSIWDMAGQDRFAVMRPGFYKGSRAAALVFDVTDGESFADLRRWHAEITKVTPRQKFVVVGNKIDLPRAVESSAIAEYAASIHAAYVETSAATGEGVPKLFETLASLAVA